MFSAPLPNLENGKLSEAPFTERQYSRSCSISMPAFYYCLLSKNSQKYLIDGHLLAEKAPIQEINRVMDYIRNILESTLTIEVLTRLTHCSYWHFHSVFTAVAGEPPARYVLCKRLERAALMLLNTEDEPVTHIAYACGFGSVKVLCRNCKRHFGMAPGAYRGKKGQQQHKNRPLLHNKEPTARFYSHCLCSRKTFMIGDKKMECTFEITQLAPFQMIYSRHYGPYDQMQGTFGVKQTGGLKKSAGIIH